MSSFGFICPGEQLYVENTVAAAPDKGLAHRNGFTSAILVSYQFRCGYSQLSSDFSEMFYMSFVCFGEGLSCLHSYCSSLTFPDWQLPDLTSCRGPPDALPIRGSSHPKSCGIKYPPPLITRMCHLLVAAFNQSQSDYGLQ